MNVQLLKIVTRHHDPDHGRTRGFIQATVDGFGVVCRESRGWDCRCTETDCAHIAAVVAVIAPEVVAQIKAGRTR